jgi:hypothetical protein
MSNLTLIWFSISQSSGEEFANFTAVFAMLLQVAMSVIHAHLQRAEARRFEAAHDADAV